MTAPTPAGSRRPFVDVRSLRRGGRPVLVAATLVGLAAMWLPWTGWYYSHTSNDQWSYTLSSDGTSGLATGFALPGLALVAAVALAALLHRDHPLLARARYLPVLAAPAMVVLGLVAISRDADDSRWLHEVDGFHSPPAGPYLLFVAALLSLVGGLLLLRSLRRDAATATPAPAPGPATPAPGSVVTDPAPVAPLAASVAAVTPPAVGSPAAGSPPPVAAVPATATTPAPTAPDGADSTSPAPQPQWDPRRNQWVVRRPGSADWVGWDDAAQAWLPLAVAEPAPPSPTAPTT